MMHCSSEGVQLGSVHGPWGIMGTWSTIHHTEQDPIGKFCTLFHMLKVVLTTVISMWQGRSGCDVRMMIRFITSLEDTAR
jgi:hypothetical protein